MKEIDGKQYLTVSEFAQKIGKSKQAIYLRLKKVEDPLKEYVMDDKEHVLIAEEAASIFDEKRPASSQVDDMARTINELRIKQLETELEAARQRLNDKVDLIKDRDSQIEKLEAEKEEWKKERESMNARLDYLIQVATADKARPPVLDGKIKDAQPEPEPRSWWKRFFR